MLLCSSELQSFSTESAFRGMRDSKLGAHRWGRAGQARACPLATFNPEPCPRNADVTDLVPCKFGDRIRIAAAHAQLAEIRKVSQGCREQPGICETPTSCI